MYWGLRCWLWPLGCVELCDGLRVVGSLKFGAAQVDSKGLGFTGKATEGCVRLREGV